MNYEDAKVGMKVRISTNITKTHAEFDSNPHMRRMRGNIGEVVKLTMRNGVRVRGYGGTWTFLPCDLSSLTLFKKPEPVMFDPENIEKGV